MDKTVKVELLTIGAIIVILIILSFFVTISSTIFGTMGCITVVFDKFDVMNADKAVLCKGEESYTITSQELIDEIAKQTLVAEYSGIQYGKTDLWIELYRGDGLVRRMNYSGGTGMVQVYESDIAHWMILSFGSEGYANISEELKQALDELIAANLS